MVSGLLPNDKLRAIVLREERWFRTRTFGRRGSPSSPLKPIVTPAGVFVYVPIPEGGRFHDNVRYTRLYSRDEGHRPGKPRLDVQVALHRITPSLPDHLVPSGL